MLLSRRPSRRDGPALRRATSHRTRLAPRAPAPRAAHHCASCLAPRMVAPNPSHPACAAHPCASRLASCALAPCASHGHTRPTPYRVHPAPSALCRAPTHASCRPRLAPHAVLPHAASTSLHWTAVSRWAHIATACFMRFRCILLMFHLAVAKILFQKNM
jgi:hypothetical protein